MKMSNKITILKNAFKKPFQRKMAGGDETETANTSKKLIIFIIGLLITAFVLSFAYNFYSKAKSGINGSTDSIFNIFEEVQKDAKSK